MPAKLKWTLAAAGLILALAAAYFAYQKLSPSVDPADPFSADAQSSDVSHSESESRTEAVDFIAFDTDGQPVKLFDSLDKPLILNFWASTCGPCQSEMPHLQKAYEELSDQYNFFMLDMIGFFGETQESAQAYLDEEGYTFPVYFDTEHNGAYTYGINSIPTTVFISQDGYIAGAVQGALTESRLYGAIEKFFGSDS